MNHEEFNEIVHEISELDVEELDELHTQINEKKHSEIEYYKSVIKEIESK